MIMMLKYEIIVISLENITGGSEYRYCNIKAKLNHKTPVVFHNLKNYDSFFNLQELDKFSLKTDVIPNELE